MDAYDIEHYLNSDTFSDPFSEWITRLRDVRAKVAIIRRIGRIENGNFGDHRSCREGVWELRIDFGPGYRVYYAVHGRRIVLLLCGGDKRTQTADIDKAVYYWHDWQRRQDDEESPT